MPLDGATIASKLSRGYRNFLTSENNRSVVIALFVLAFVFSVTILFTVSRVLSEGYVDLVQAIFFH